MTNFLFSILKSFPSNCSFNFSFSGPIRNSRTMLKIKPSPVKNVRIQAHTDNNRYKSVFFIPFFVFFIKYKILDLVKQNAQATLVACALVKSIHIILFFVPILISLKSVKQLSDLDFVLMKSYCACRILS